MATVGRGAGRGSVKERLIQAGIREICENGIQNFSTRRVAAKCGVSCAAPYKHFADQRALIQAILDRLNQEWYSRQEVVVRKYEGDVRRQLTEVSMAYIRFLVEYPNFRSTIMLKNVGEDNERLAGKGEMSECTKRLIAQYCREAGLADETRVWKTYVVRSLIYGAALMLDNGELPNEEHIYQIIANVIDREFTLP